jgi:2-hydroxy-4-carboxymuconate semialdehyde hemiacetal dehydrogenase
MNICLAGTGAMGEIHAKALAKIEGVEIVSVAGRTADGARDFAAKWNVPFHSTDLPACIDRPGVDAVILTTPSDQHCSQTLLALSRGRHVQVEIPMALNLSDSRRMLEAAK